MIRPDLGGVFLAIISHRRPQAVTPMHQLVGHATWFVADDQDAQTYSKAPGMESLATLRTSGRLCNSRNAALREAWAMGLPCVQLSDDLKKVERAVSNGVKNVATYLDFAEAVGLVLGGMRQTGAKLGGVAPTSNAFYSNLKRPYHNSAFIVGDFIVVEPCDLHFDENLRLKEDYDYTLQHLKRFGRVSRCDIVLASFLHRANAGGAVDYRTAEREQEAIAYLKSKWGGYIRDNTKRPNEILLNLPKRKA